jgi:hypothetical protein
VDEVLSIMNAEREKMSAWRERSKKKPMRLDVPSRRDPLEISPYLQPVREPPAPGLPAATGGFALRTILPFIATIRTKGRTYEVEVTRRGPSP